MQLDNFAAGDNQVAESSGNLNARQIYSESNLKDFQILSQAKTKDDSLNSDLPGFELTESISKGDKQLDSLDKILIRSDRIDVNSEEDVQELADRLSTESLSDSPETTDMITDMVERASRYGGVGKERYPAINGLVERLNEQLKPSGRQLSIELGKQDGSGFFVGLQDTDGNAIGDRLFVPVSETQFK